MSTSQLSSEHSFDLIPKSSWIWMDRASPDQYVCFRRSFRLLRDVDARSFVEISVDTDFVAFLNGVEFARGQFSDFPDRKTWDRFSIGDIAVPGENILTVLVFYKGEDFFDYRTGTAGLLFCLESGSERIVSDASWRVSSHSAFRSGRGGRVTKQMGFTFDYDARRKIPWRNVSFDDSSWPFATIVQHDCIGPIWRELTRRPLSRLKLGNMISGRIATQGRFTRRSEKGTTAEIMANSAVISEFPWQAFKNHELQRGFSAPSAENQPDIKEEYTGCPLNAGSLVEEGGCKSLRIRETNHLTDGRYLILDLEKECVGLLEFSVDTSEGAIIEIAHGEHLKDGRVRAFVEGRCFADRYICCEGRQHFQMPFRRLAGRYLEIHISGFSTFSLHFAGLRLVEYPTERLGAFDCGDYIAEKIQCLAVRTLELCRHEHYEDCPWREQALYAYDSRLQALYGYYAFGDYRFPWVSFDILGRSIDESGLVALTAPGYSEVNIPMFSLAWIVAVAEHALHSGDISLGAKFGLQIERILSDALARRDAQTGLYKPPEGSGYWHFYEWVPGLSGAIGQISLNGSLHAGYNMHLHEALDAYLSFKAEVKADSVTFMKEFEELGFAIHRSFWDESAQYYRSELTKDGRRIGGHELIQSLAIHQGLVPISNVEAVMRALRSGNLDRCSLSASYYVLKACLSHSPISRVWVSERLRSIWREMIGSGATSMWETEHGADDFDFAASLCHGWSALPVWFHQAVILGIRPLAIGFEKFGISIYPAMFKQARGVIPTPHGSISVAWELVFGALTVKVTGPRKCIPQLLVFEETNVVSATYNETELVENECESAS